MPDSEPFLHLGLEFFLSNFCQIELDKSERKDGRFREKVGYMDLPCKPLWTELSAILHRSHSNNQKHIT